MRASFETFRRLYLPILGGVLLGTAGSLIATSIRSSSAQQALSSARRAPESSEEPPAAGAHTVLTRDPAVEALERRIEELEGRTAAANALTSTAAPPPPLPPAEARARNVAAHHESVRAHWAEATDPSWARAASETLQNDFTSLEGTAQFQTTRVDCRSTTCVADVRFGSYANAETNWPTLLHHAYTAGCAVEIMLDEPTDRAIPFETTVFFDCSRSRGQP